MTQQPRLRRKLQVLPGFSLTLGYSLFYLCLLVLIPLGMLVVKTSELTWSKFWFNITDPEILASFRLSFGGSIIAAIVNVFFGLLVAWVLVRYEFPGKRLIDGIVDLPFALPTSVSGIALAAIYSSNGWFGAPLEKMGIKVAYTQLGVMVALIFVGLPFVVRTVQPVIQDVDAEIEEAAASLGAGRWTTFRRVIFPLISPALITGFALALARAIGEYGSVVFISGNLPMKTEIAPVLIINKIDQRDYAGATGIALVMLIASFLLLIGIHFVHWRSGRRTGLVGGRVH